LGLVANLARPGGNITGLTASLGPEIAGKQLELLKETVAKVSRVSALWNPETPGNVLALKEAETAARALGVELQPLEARGLEAFDDAFGAMAANRAGALLVLGDVCSSPTEHGWPNLPRRTAFPPCTTSESSWTTDGGLMSYGAKISANFRCAATYVDKILRGAKPADLPIERPSTFELIVNVKTAKALGLTIPQSVLARADQIIA